MVVLDNSVISSEPLPTVEHHENEESEHEGELPEHYDYHQHKGSQHGEKEPIDLDGRFSRKASRTFSKHI